MIRQRDAGGQAADVATLQGGLVERFRPDTVRGAYQWTYWLARGGFRAAKQAGALPDGLKLAARREQIFDYRYVIHDLRVLRCRGDGGHAQQRADCAPRARLDAATRAGTLERAKLLYSVTLRTADGRAGRSPTPAAPPWTPSVGRPQQTPPPGRHFGCDEGRNGANGATGGVAAAAGRGEQRQARDAW